MRWTSIVAIYVLFWVMSAYIALRFGMKTHDEAGVARVPGQEDSAPAYFSPWRVALHGTLIATVLFTLYYANWVNEWITLDVLDVWLTPPRYR
ncbi:MAG: DUF1467 family protein [Novosphingobium sp.]